MASDTATGDTRAGFVALIGAPNAGKSTLINRLVGTKVSIVSHKVQTTRTIVRGIAMIGRSQVIFVDTPGIFRPKRRLDRAMVETAWGGARDADLVAVLIDAAKGVDAEAEALLDKLVEVPQPKILLLNKIDTVKRDSLLPVTAQVNEKFKFDRTFMISAATGDGLDDLTAYLAQAVPAGPFLYPEDEIASDPVRFFVAELVRETVFEQFRQEIPYSVFCQVEEFREGQEPLYVAVNVYVERKSQKGMLIGKGGSAIRELGAASRAKIEHFLGRAVYLDLWVKPLAAWRRSRAHLGRLGFRLPPDDSPNAQAIDAR